MPGGSLKIYYRCRGVLNAERVAFDFEYFLSFLRIIDSRP